MKVLNVLVGAGIRLGGTSAFVAEGAVELGKLGADVGVVATDIALAPWGYAQRQRRLGPDELHPALDPSGVRIFAARFPRRLAFSPDLARWLSREAAQYEVLHIHNLWQFPQYAAARASRRHRLPYVVSPHGGLDPYLRHRGRIRKRVSTALWQRRMLEGAALIHVTTEAEREAIADVAPHVPRAVVPCGIHAEEFAHLPPRDVFRRERLGGYEGPVILYLGRITEKKGLDVLVRAFARVRRARACQLVIAGPDDSRMLPSISRLASALGVRSHVKFVGPIYGEARLAALSCADVWALSSHTENFGIAVVEAMAAGRAVAVSPSVSVSSDVAAARAGVVAEPEPRAFAQALLDVLADDHARVQLSHAARDFAARYDWKVVAPRLLRMYRAALSGETRATPAGARRDRLPPEPAPSAPPQGPR